MKNIEEIWKDIPRYEGLYQASNTGKIRTCEGKTTYTKLHGIRYWKSRELKFKNNYNKNFIGYRVTLWKDGVGKDFLVHRLIATTFLEDLIDTKMQVNHIDGNRANNNIENLEWCTCKQNNNHMFNNNLNSSQKNISISNNNGETFNFRSLLECDRFLERYKGYVCGKIARNNSSNAILTSKNGIEYFINKIESPNKRKLIKDITNKKCKNISICKCDLYGNAIKKYDSISEAYEDNLNVLNCSKNCFSAAMSQRKNGYKIYSGYMWTF